MGSEFEVLNSFDFSQHSSVVIYVEHNYLGNRPKLKRLLGASIYLQVHPSYLNLMTGFSKKLIRWAPKANSIPFGLRISVGYTAILTIVKHYYRRLEAYLKATDSLFLAYALRTFFLGLALGLKWRELPFWIRQIISLAQPSDPLSKIVGPPIDVAIPCHAKDLKNLPLVIEGAVTNIRNPIGKILLITPEECSLELQRMFPDCQVVRDETLLGPELVSFISEMVPKEKRGWVTQQVLKFRVASLSQEIGTLIIDADTVLLRPRVWVGSNNSQVICFANEYHYPYKEHQRKVFGGRSHLMSFVTHHQLMKTEVVRDIFGSDQRALLNWLRLADYREQSALSEFDTYGEWITSNRPKEARFAKWNNLHVKVPPGTRYADLRAKYGEYHSVSNHSYL